ncbi:hypothetical protein RB2150_17872 [Rhodobacterales bacterium HTCC2150]|nr:hypothetical protein RB2150_17872 [Rhodobacterales bacterium HTCC2150] [Rhodobacteraceae bacterium HTCC2150]
MDGGDAAKVCLEPDLWIWFTRGIRSHRVFLSVRT